MGEVNHSSERQYGRALDFQVLLWGFLEQWKAILIVALLMAILFAGGKYFKDAHLYEKELESSKQEAVLSIEERIENTIRELPDNERETVEYVYSIQKECACQKEYLSNSLLMKSNLSNQRTLLMRFLIKTENTERIPDLIQSYAGSIYSKSVINGLKSVIGSDEKDQYIYELVYLDGEQNETGDVLPDGNMLRVNIVLPDGTDSKEIEKVFVDTIKNQGKAFNSTVTPHTISLAYSDEVYINNERAASDYATLVQTISTADSLIKSMDADLTENQRAALDKIGTIMASKSEEVKDTNQSDSSPGIDIRIALVGIVFGIFLYAVFYLAVVVLRGRLLSSNEVEHCSGYRLLGEVCCEEKKKGLYGLFHSRLVVKLRCRNEEDRGSLKRIVSSIVATCKHVNANAITLVSFSEDGDAFQGILENLIAGLENNDIRITPLPVSHSIDEESFVNSHPCVFYVTSDTKGSSVFEVRKLCQAYDIDCLGVVFAKER